jgi:hypothetical protein
LCNILQVIWIVVLPVDNDDFLLFYLHQCLYAR